MKLKHCVSRLAKESIKRQLSSMEMRFRIGSSDGGCRNASVWIT